MSPRFKTRAVTARAGSAAWALLTPASGSLGPSSFQEWRGVCLCPHQQARLSRRSVDGPTLGSRALGASEDACVV